LEALHRRAAPATEGSFDPDNVRACKKRYLEEHGSAALQEATRRSLALLWQRIAHQTGISRADIGYLVLPQLGRQLLEENYLPALDLPRAQVDIDAGLGLGHLGCADQLVGLIPLLNDRRARGELVLLVGGGAGFNWTLCLMELC
jgi:3-oxoacyl-[acyl-carrier-protein] synthase-3